MNVLLEHESKTIEAGSERVVAMSIKALALGTVAERLSQQPLGSVWRFQGFLANARQGKSVVLHIQDFVQD